MKTQKSIFAAFIALLVILITGGCATNIHMVTQLPGNTSTPFQPVTATLTATATSTISPTATPIPPTSTATSTPVPDTPTPSAEPQTDEPINVDPTSISTQSIKTGMITVPILLYHHISETVDTQYNVRPDRFAEQVRWLYDHGYSTVTIADVVRAIREGGELPPRPVVLTFDDGYLDVFQNAFPILSEYGYVASFYIIANTVDAPGSLSTKKLKKLLANGWEIGSHSMTHADLTYSSDWENEIDNSKLVLEEKLGTEIVTFCYPYGKANDAIRLYTSDSGYLAAVGLGSIMDHDANDLFFLHRKEIKSWYGLDFFEGFMPWVD